MNNIAIFQADHPLHIHTINIVKGLEAGGYKVELFLYNCNFDCDNIQGLTNVYNLSNIHTYWSQRKTPIAKFAEAINYFFFLPMKVKQANLLPPAVFHESINIVNREKYLCFIGVEKLGFVWASIISSMFPTHILYYSLELYPTSDVFKYPLNKLSSLKGFRFIRLRQLEKLYHKKAKATIIQDSHRADAIMKMNNVHKMDNIYLPVSLMGPPIREKNNYLRDRFSIPINKRIILQFGIIGKNRSVVEVARESQSFPDDWILIFHGPIYDDNIRRSITAIDKKKKIIISSNIVPPDEIDDLVSSADIGLCFYPKEHINDYLTGYSSEKLVRYLRCGIPVVTFDYPTFLDSVARNGCGICLRDLSSLNVAISEILNDYENYRTKAYEAFENSFEFNRQFEKVVSYIGRL